MDNYEIENLANLTEKSTDKIEKAANNEISEDFLNFHDDIGEEKNHADLLITSPNVPKIEKSTEEEPVLLKDAKNEKFISSEDLLMTDFKDIAEPVPELPAIVAPVGPKKDQEEVKKPIQNLSDEIGAENVLQNIGLGELSFFPSILNKR